MALAFRLEDASRSRKRRTFLSRDEIVGAAAAILKRYGYDALNMRSVAAELGVQAAALYRYIDSREELDDLLFDHLMAGCMPIVKGKDWRVDFRNLCRTWRSHLNKKRDVTRIALSQVSIGPNIALLMEASLRILRHSGLDDAGVVDAYHVSTAFVLSFARAEAIYLELASRSDGTGLRQAPLKPNWASDFPTLMALSDDLSKSPNFDAQFIFGVDALIAGIEKRASARLPVRRHRS